MMVTVQERSALVGLEARRVVVRRELFQVNRQIRQAEQAQARLEERIEILEEERRQAAA
jgi:hypothetical protein